MAYQFPPDVEELIKRQIAVGAYDSEDDLIRDALKALDEQNAVLINEDQAVIDGIRRGLADMKEGRFQSVVEFDAEFCSKHNIPQDGNAQWTFRSSFPAMKT